MTTSPLKTIVSEYQTGKLTNHDPLQAVKSIIIITYQLVTEHMARFARWRSFKANVILNCIEIVFWLAAIVVKFMGISRRCSGGSCAVNWIIVLVAMAIL